MMPEVIRIWLGPRPARAPAGPPVAPVLVCFAVPEEAAPFRHQLSVGVEILVTGMGRANAERSIRARLAQGRPQMVLTCGFGGGLNPKLEACTVVFSEDETTGLALDLGKLGAVPGHMHCASRVVTTVDEKAGLWKSTGADVVEMESGVIREICREQRIPSATVRVVSDTAEEDLPLDFNALMTPEYRINFAKLAAKLMTSPGKIPALMRLQKRTREAAERLSRVLVELLRPRVERG